MKVKQLSLVLAIISFWSPLMAATGRAETGAERPPNIVFVLADDLGWAELGCYGNRFHETPNLDRMAEEGLRFTRAYAAAPVCSPYRAALLTGQHPARLGILDYLRPNSANRLAADLRTLPEVLRGNGYRTGMIGKWHLTGYDYHGAEFETRPTDHGFDWNLGSEVKSVGNGANTWPYVFRTQPIRWIDLPNHRLGPEENLTDRLNLEAVDFIERNQDRPFFLLLAHYAPHSILNGRPDLVEKYQRKHSPGKSGRDNCYLCEDAGFGKGDPGHHWAVDHNPHLAAMLEGIDDGIGMIRQKLEARGLLEDTIFIFSSDNGGESNVTSNSPLRGGKSELYEGGIRVPLVMQWPRRIASGSVNSQPTMNTDFFPSLLEATGTAHPIGHHMDGVSTFKSWVQPSVAVERGALHWHYPIDRPHFLGGFSGGGILEDNWKLIERFDTGTRELYHLGRDPSEQSDLAGRNPEKVAELREQLSKWRLRVGARTPSAPLIAQPHQLAFAEHFSGQTSSRLRFSGKWTLKNGMLVHDAGRGEGGRIELNDATLRDFVVRFDFQLRDARSLRFVAAPEAADEVFVEIRPDRFLVQTGTNKPAGKGEAHESACSFSFDRDHWYSMTIEVIGDQLVAHTDRQHSVYARDAFLDRDWQALLLRVGGAGAVVDNLQVLAAKRHPRYAENMRHIVETSSRRSLE